MPKFFHPKSVGQWILLSLFIFLVGILCLWFLKTPIISSYLSHKMKVRVSMQSIDLSSSEAEIKGFTISNPLGSKSRHAFSSEKIKIDYELSDLFGDPCVIDLIDLDKVLLNVEFYNPLGTKNNWTEIGAKIPSNKGGKEVFIRKLILRNIVIEIQGMGIFGKGSARKKIGQIELQNISSKQGFPTEQLIQVIFHKMGLEQYIKNLFNPEKILSPFFQFGFLENSCEKREANGHLERKENSISVAFL